MGDKLTKRLLAYPNGQEPNIVYPSVYGKYRYALGKSGEKPLVAICMNPSVAREDFSDSTINRIIKLSQTLNMDGWMVFNLYPERATDATYLRIFDSTVSEENLHIIKSFLNQYDIVEVWGAWGDDKGIQALFEGKKQLLSMLKENNIKVYYFGTLTKAGNPRHPIQRTEKWNYNDKHFLVL